MAALSATMAIAESGGAIATRKVARSVAAAFEGEYDEQVVKEMVLSQLDLISDGVKALRHKEFMAAQSELTLWANSAEPGNSTMNMDRLKAVYDNASIAAAAVEKPIDRVRAVSMQIYAAYHRQAFVMLQEGRPPQNVGARRSARRK